MCIRDRWKDKEKGSFIFLPMALKCIPHSELHLPISAKAYWRLVRYGVLLSNIGKTKYEGLIFFGLYLFRISKADCPNLKLCILPVFLIVFETLLLSKSICSHCISITSLKRRPPAKTENKNISLMTCALLSSFTSIFLKSSNWIFERNILLLGSFFSLICLLYTSRCV